MVQSQHIFNRPPVKITNPNLGTTVKKPMVYYTEETPGVNKRMVAGYYLFLCLIGFAILLGPTGSGIPITLIGNEVSEEHYVATPGLGTDPSDCIGCHDNEYNNWSTTHHATHMVTNGTHMRIGAYAWFASLTAHAPSVTQVVGIIPQVPQHTML